MGSEPMPQGGCDRVADHAVEAFTRTFYAQVDAGVEKYGTPLRTFNGRNAANDAREELADLLQYMTQLEIERDTLAQVLVDLRDAVHDDTWRRLVPPEVRDYVTEIHGLE